MDFNKIIIWLLCTLAAIVVVVGLVSLVPKQQKMKQMEESVAKLEDELALKKAEIQKLKENFDGLHSNPETIEKVAREKYELCKDGEIVYKYSPEDLMQMVGPVGIEPTTR